MENTQEGNGYFFAVGNPDIGGMPEVVGYDDSAPPIFVTELNQDGGKYSKINDPKTGKSYSTKSKKGKKILQGYLNLILNYIN